MTGITTYEDVDSWELPNGDRVLIVRASTKHDNGNRTRRFHFTIVAPNGAKVGTSGETFTRKRYAVRAAERHHPRVDVAE